MLFHPSPSFQRPFLSRFRALHVVLRGDALPLHVVLAVGRRLFGQGPEAPWHEVR